MKFLYQDLRNVSIGVKTKTFWGVHQWQSLNVVSVFINGLALGNLVACEE